MSLRQLLYCILWAYSVAAWLEINILLTYLLTYLQSYWTSKFGKIIPYAIFAQKRTLSCVTKIILTAKLFGVGSSHFGFVHLDNWGTQ